MPSHGPCAAGDSGPHLVPAGDNCSKNLLAKKAVKVVRTPEKEEDSVPSYKDGDSEQREL